MLVTVRIAGILLLLALVTGILLNVYLVQAGDSLYKAGKCNFVVSERKVSQTISENKIKGRKVSDYDIVKMEMMKEIGPRARYTRKSRILMSKENHRASYVAFTVDYKAPRHHPPKNN